MHVEVRGTRLWFDVDGPALVPDGPAMRERPTVVLLHGGPGSFDHSYFKPDFARLAQVAQVVYLDLRDHGRSAWGDPASWGFELAADDVAAFCDALGIARPVVYGHSLAEEWARCWRLFGPWVLGDQEQARTIVNRELNPLGLALMREFDVLDRLAGVDCPTLVCVGELDPVTPVAAARELAAALPEGLARLEVVQGAGHFTWKDAPDRYWPLLAEFVTHPGPPQDIETVYCPYQDEQLDR
jgi:pimeloyl-ACP methyl ester carboxylesterase